MRYSRELPHLSSARRSRYFGDQQACLRKNRCVATARLRLASVAEVESALDVGIGGLLVAIESLKRFSGSDNSKSADAMFKQKGVMSLNKIVQEFAVGVQGRASSSINIGLSRFQDKSTHATNKGRTSKLHKACRA
jgi:hypothetical protein